MSKIVVEDKYGNEVVRNTKSVKDMTRSLKDDLKNKKMIIKQFQEGLKTGVCGCFNENPHEQEYVELANTFMEEYNKNMLARIDALRNIVQTNIEQDAKILADMYHRQEKLAIQREDDDLLELEAEKDLYDDEDIDIEYDASNDTEEFNRDFESFHNMN